MHQHFIESLRHPHGRENSASCIGPHQQIDLVGRHHLLVKSARQFRFGLVVFHDPLHLAAQQPTPGIELLDVNFPDEFVRECRGGQRPGQRQRAADSHRRTRLRLG